jgi:hypothetical protein
MGRSVNELRDWRYWVTYEGRVEAPDEKTARQAAMDDVDAGKLPVITVEQEGDEGNG